MIEVHCLSKSYGEKRVLDGVSFSAPNGLVTGFVGPNGAGKSTTMRMIAALENPDEGYTLVDGQPYAKAAMPARMLGIYLGSEYLPNHLSVTEYLEYVCGVSGIPKGNIPHLIEIVELSHAADKPISSYSLGMRQRAGLAAAIAGNPNTLMLDEPVNGLDPMGVQWLRTVIRSQADAGRAVLLSSHLLSELELVADNVVMLDRGKIVRMGSMRELEAMTGSLQVLLHTSNDAKFGAYLSKKGYRVSPSDNAILIEGIAPDKLARLVLKANLSLFHLEQKKASLEELFMSTAKMPPTSNGAHSAQQHMHQPQYCQSQSEQYQQPVIHYPPPSQHYQQQNATQPQMQQQDQHIRGQVTSHE